ncbi:anti-sigma factor domain-containing protein [Bacillus sp. MRMR6]|uniref:anti-sigma factor domain-containing protein n=1 Tax=Bacillus sp. MRMR6 TaxID=1928617 RepID=UPI000952536B|nr:anti-sigma factor domain-containing protein [Bacillus sp. MRMR6]OLS41887.1 hypothetical protein BTR25_00525 [Bacillus sp. MRMR6]
MKKGIIMDMNNSYLTLLTSEGEFLRAHKHGNSYQIGEEIDFFPINAHQGGKVPYSLRSVIFKRSVWVSMIALFICMSAIIPIYQSNKAYAYMSIDANSSIELGLNKRMQVVEINGFNQDTNKFISQLSDWEKTDVSDLALLIVSKLKEKGLANNGPIVISTVETEDLNSKLGAKLQANIEEIKANTESVEVKTYIATEEDVQAARDLGIPIGQYYKDKNKSLQDGETNELPKQLEIENPSNKVTTPSVSLPGKESAPGQLKKETEDSQPNNKNSNNVEKNSQQNSREESKLAPGQQKKTDENISGTLRQNNGQKNKQSNEKNNSTNKQSQQQNKNK